MQVRGYILELEESASRGTKPKHNPRIKKPQRNIKSYPNKQTKNKELVIHLH